MRPPFAALLLAAALALAPAVSAQPPASVPLAPTVGTPVAYRVDLPTRWKVAKEDDLLMVSTERLMIIVGAIDLLEYEENPLPVSEAESRRILTSMFLGSDSLMLSMLQEGAQEIKEDAAFHSVVREMRTLGGQRSAFMRGRAVGEESGWFEMHLTVKDGIMYMLAFAATDDDEFAAHEPLFARIRDSLVLAPAPTPAPK